MFWIYVSSLKEWHCYSSKGKLAECWYGIDHGYCHYIAGYEGIAYDGTANSLKEAKERALDPLAPEHRTN